MKREHAQAHIFGMMIGIPAAIGLGYMLGWKVIVLIFLLLWSNNLSLAGAKGNEGPMGPPGPPGPAGANGRDAALHVKAFPAQKKASWWDGSPIGTSKTVEEANEEIGEMRQDWQRMGESLGFDSFTDPEVMFAKAEELLAYFKGFSRAEKPGPNTRVTYKGVIPAPGVPFGWYTMDSVPKDGTRVELLGENGKFDKGCWEQYADWALDDPEWMAKNDPDGWRGEMNTDNGEGPFVAWSPLS